MLAPSLPVSPPPVAIPTRQIDLRAQWERSLIASLDTLGSSGAYVEISRGRVTVRYTSDTMILDPACIERVEGSRMLYLALTDPRSTVAGQDRCQGCHGPPGVCQATCLRCTADGWRREILGLNAWDVPRRRPRSWDAQQAQHTTTIRDLDILGRAAVSVYRSHGRVGFKGDRGLVDAVVIRRVAQNRVLFDALIPAVRQGPAQPCMLDGPSPGTLPNGQRCLRCHAISWRRRLIQR
jgi:hypothetical protein